MSLVIHPLEQPGNPPFPRRANRIRVAPADEEFYGDVRNNQDSLIEVMTPVESTAQVSRGKLSSGRRACSYIAQSDKTYKSE